MIRWSPGTELANLNGAMDRLFDDFFSPTSAGNGDQRQLMPTYFLPLDIREAEYGYEIQAPVPGFKPEDVEITFSEGVLKIHPTLPEVQPAARRVPAEGGCPGQLPAQHPAAR